MKDYQKNADAFLGCQKKHSFLGPKKQDSFFGSKMSIFMTWKNA